MDKLIYADVIAKEQTFTALADLGLALDELPIDKLLIRLIDLVDSEHLPILADSMSVAGVDGYWLAESDEARRNLIKGAYELHRYKGTPWAVKEIVRRLGFGSATLIEGFGGKRHNGEITRRDGVYNYGHSGRITASSFTNPSRLNRRTYLERLYPLLLLLAVSCPPLILRRRAFGTMAKSSETADTLVARLN